MKSYCFLLVALFCTCFAHAQKLQSFSEKQGDTYYYGYKDSLGKIIIQPKFKEAAYMYDGRAKVSEDGKIFGYIGPDGTFAIPLQYEGASSFYQGLAWVKKQGYWGAIDKYNNVKIPFRYAVQPGDFSEGLAVFTADNGLKGYLDKTGKEVIPARYNTAFSFYEGARFAVVGNAKPKGDWDFMTIYLYGLIDKTGKEHIPLKYTFLQYSSAYDRVVMGNGGCQQFLGGHDSTCLVGLARTDGTFLTPQKYTAIEMSTPYHHVYVGSNQVMGTEMGGTFGCIDNNGKEVLAPIYDNESLGWLGVYDDIYSGYVSDQGYAEGLFTVAKDKKWGYVDINGKTVIPFQYSKASLFSNGKALVTKDEKQFIINKNGDKIEDYVSSYNSEESGDEDIWGGWLDGYSSGSTGTYTTPKVQEPMYEATGSGNFEKGHAIAKEITDIYNEDLYAAREDKNYKIPNETFEDVYRKYYTAYKYFSKAASQNFNTNATDYQMIFTATLMAYYYDYVGQTKNAEELLREEKSRITRIQDMKIDYTIGNTRYTITEESKRSSFYNFYVLLAKAAKRNYNKEEELESRKLAVKFGDGKLGMLQAKDVQSLYKNKFPEKTAERVEWAITTLEKYNQLDILDRKDLEKDHPYLVSDMIAELEKNIPAGTDRGNNYIKAATVLQKNNRTATVNSFYEKALKEQLFLPSLEQLTVIGNYATEQHNNALLQVLVDKMLAMEPPANCEFWNKLAQYQTVLGQASNAEISRKKYTKCLKKKDVSTGRAAGSFVAMLSTEPYHYFFQDWSVKLSLGNRKLMHQFEYKKMGNNNDYHFDIDDGDPYKYDGRKLGYQIRFITPGGRNMNTFYGLQVMLDQRTYLPVSTSIYDRSTGAFQKNALTVPKQTGYEITFNWGFLQGGRAFHHELVFGFGAAYRKFDRGVTGFESLDDYEYSTVFLDQRAAARWSFIVRLNWNVGFQVGRTRNFFGIR